MKAVRNFRRMRVMMAVLLIGGGMPLEVNAGEASSANAVTAAGVVTPASAAPGGPYAEPGAKLLENIAQSTLIKQMETEKGHIAVAAGRSRVLRLTRKVGRISVSDPDILDFVILSPTEILINAREQGAANLILWDYQGNITVFDVSVTPDPSLLKAVLERLSPGTLFEVYPYNDVFVVRGEVSNARIAAEIALAAEAFAEGSVSLVRVEQTKQILLKIRFVELTNSHDYDFGIDFQYMNQQVAPIIRAGNTGGALQDDGAFTPRDSAVSYRTFTELPDTQGVHFLPYTDPSRAFFAFVEALESKGIGKIIARPNLLASDGEEASFLVGGESAIVAISDANVGVDYREFGTRLTFTPEVLPSGKIRLSVEPEVSQLDFPNGVVVNGVTIPSFITIRTSTVVELKSGETLMIGGLIQQRIDTVEAGVPFLRRLPLLGKLFQNTDYDYEDTELLVLVSPTIVNAEPGPLAEDEELFDVIDQATKFDKFAHHNDRLEALKNFVRDNRRHLINSIERFSEGRAPRIEFDRGPVTQDLEHLEHDLEWKEITVKQPKEVVLKEAGEDVLEVLTPPANAQGDSGAAEEEEGPMRVSLENRRELKELESELTW